ncbi:hypothetical protein HCN44_008349 [Aphidius gifuensis]|uniref:Cuticular protein n=1 Tax=Aphidius gifuensis TaxID=684658 RepID=A0A835CR00_APHGI|nr:larval cuticle protein A2B-like [Aphidius gifuensis]KAF7989675.1 hypothetical protein HCN44_008349 [Aphidius gifuensis]
MVTKFILIVGSIVALAHGGIIPVPAVPAVPVVRAPTDYDPHPQYSYAYSVNDAITGDAKTQHETRDGDVVIGSYSLIEADGTRRIVEYTADSLNGFNAVVHRQPAIIKTAVVPAAPVLPAAPAIPAPVPVARVSPFVAQSPVYRPPTPFYPF